MNGTHAAVIFDMDGVLVDSEPLYMRAWQEAASELGFLLTREAYCSLIGLAEEDYQGGVQELLGAHFPLVEFARRWKQLWEASLDRGELQTKPGAAVLLRSLSMARVPLALATSSSRRYMEQSLRCTGLDDYFAHTLVGEDVPRAKPAPDIYLLAAQRLGHPPHRCLVIEDSPVGAQAALSAGMTVVLIPDLAEPPPELVQRVSMTVRSLDAATPGVLRAVRPPRNS